MNESNEINVEELAELSGQKKSYPITTMKLPVISLNGKTGVFVRREPNGDKTELEDKRLQIIILRVRRSLSDFNTGMFTTEHDSPKSVCAIFERGDKFTKFVEEDLSDNLKQKYGLGTHQVLYSLYKDELVKIDVKGGSLGVRDGVGGLYDYFREFGKDYMFQYETFISPITRQAKAIEYLAMDFSKGEKIDQHKLVGVAKYITEIANTLQDRKSIEKKEQIQQIAEELPESDDGRIDLDKIPF